MIDAEISAALLDEDAESRRRALQPQSFIVEAPAGAGKTELLTQRFLKLLASVDEPEEIVALTFTNKAAGEMLARIQGSLALGAAAAAPPEPHRQLTQALARDALARAALRGWDLAGNPRRLRVMTLDSLCAGIARQMPLLSRFGVQPALAEDAGVHYAEAARRALERLEDDDAHGEAVATALRHLDNDGQRLGRLLAAMLARREQWGPLLGTADPRAGLGAAFAAVVDAELAAVAGVVDAGWQRTAMPLLRFAAENSGDATLRDWCEPLPPTASALSRWRRLADACLTAKGTPRKTLTKNDGFPPGKEYAESKLAFQSLLDGLSEPAIEALRRVRELPVAGNAEEDEAVLAALVGVLRLAAAELWLVFRERGEVDFVELALRAGTALGDAGQPSELGQRMDYRIAHLLVDEFQDTSPAQVDLLRRLTAGWTPDDGRTLFLVGDPMQSIYRFRKADVGLFLRVRQYGIGEVSLTPLQLRRNNRSCPAVVGWINERFPGVLSARDNPLAGEVAYRSFAATRETLPAAGVFVHPVMSSAAPSDADAGAAEAGRVADLLEATWRGSAERQVAVLVRARDHLRGLVAELRARGMRFAAVEIDPLLDRQCVQDLISLTRALHHRADRLHWLAILRAPWCGLTLADLHALAADRPEATVWSLMCDGERLLRLSADGQARLRPLVAVLASVLEAQGRQSRRRWVEDAWRLLGGPECLRDAADLADARAYFDRLEALDRAGRFSLDRLSEDMARLYAAPDSGADGRLQLMTIHKAKGLEFDTVIVMGLHRRTPNGDSPLVAWDTALVGDDERLLAAPMPRRTGGAAGGAGTTPGAYDYLLGLERRRSRNEEARLLYVAATRAIRCLHLVGAVSRKEAGIAEPHANTLLARLWPAFAAQLALVPAEGAPPEVPAAKPALGDFIPALVRRAVAPETPAGLPPGTVAMAATAATGGDADDSVDDRAGDAFAAAVGTLAHACLEQAGSDPAGWRTATLASRRQAFVAWLRSRGWSPAESGQGADRVLAMLAATLDSADGRWVLQARPGAVSELALTKVGAGGTALTRVMDRSFVDGGVRWIVDFKSVRLDDAAVLEDHAARYRSQLAGYAALFAGEGLPVRAGILYLAHGRLIVLDRLE